MAMRRSLKDAKESQIEPFVECMTALLYAALVVEAFINHAGEQIFPFWLPLKKKLSPTEKIEICAASKNLKIDWGARPFQSVASVMLFRNMIVHADSHAVETKHLYDSATPGNKTWHSYCKLPVAQRICEDVESMLKQMPELFAFTIPPEFLLSEGIGSNA